LPNPVAVAWRATNGCTQSTPSEVAETKIMAAGETTMNRKLLKDILAIHADQLAQNRRTNTEDYPELSPEDKQELAPLLDVAERVKSTLRPVNPPRKFETNLKKELLTTAHLRQAKGYTPPNPEKDLLILLAIVGFFISLAGVLLALRLRREGIKTVTPPQS
jgi:hypothetical protein